MSEGTGLIRKALSGFYYVDDGSGELISCRARGKFRKEGVSPLVGDRVEVRELGNGEVFPRVPVHWTRYYPGKMNFNGLLWPTLINWSSLPQELSQPRIHFSSTG